MKASEVFESLKPYLVIIDCEFDSDWYGVKEDYVVVLNERVNVPLYIEALSIDEEGGKIKFETTNSLEQHERGMYTYDVDAEVDLSFSVFKLENPVLQY